MITTARAIVTRALRLIQVIAANEEGSAADVDAGFDALNSLTDSWSIKRNFLYAETVETFNLVDGKRVYDIGPAATAGNFVTAVPWDVTEASFITFSNLDYPLRSVTPEQYAEITLKTVDGIPALFCFVKNPTLAQLSLYPTPMPSMTIELHSTKPLSQFSGLDVSTTIMPGYLEALQFSLAENLAPEFETEPPKFVTVQALKLRKAVQRMNVVVPIMDIGFVPAPLTNNNPWGGGFTGTADSGDVIVPVP